MVAKETKSRIETRDNRPYRQTGNIKTHQQQNQRLLSVSIWERTVSIGNFH